MRPYTKILTMPCGCSIWGGGYYRDSIKYCSLHGAAFDLLEALKAIRDSEENDLGEYAEFCEQTARAALAKVEEV